MKAKLTFDLPEEQSEFNLTIKAREWFCVLFDVDQKLRSYLKHGHHFTEVDEALQEVRDYLYQQMADYGINFDD